MIKIVLAGAPRGKERVKRGAQGHAYTPDRTVRFEDRLALAAQTVMDGRPPLEGPLELCVEMYFPVPESKPAKWKNAALAGQIRPTVKPDWDNGGKLTDAFNLIVWVDDKQIVAAHVFKWYSRNPRTVVQVNTVNHPEGLFA